MAEDVSDSEMIMCRLKHSDRLLVPKRMDSSSSVCDNTSEVDYYPCSSSDRITRLNGDVGCSTPGGDSSDYSRTISEISTFSEPSSSSDEPLHSMWPLSRMAGRGSPLLRKLGMKQHAKVQNLRTSDDEVSNSGNIVS